MSQEDKISREGTNDASVCACAGLTKDWSRQTMEL